MGVCPNGQVIQTSPACPDPSGDIDAGTTMGPELFLRTALQVQSRKRTVGKPPLSTDDEHNKRADHRQDPLIALHYPFTRMQLVQREMLAEAPQEPAVARYVLADEARGPGEREHQVAEPRELVLVVEEQQPGPVLKHEVL